MRRHMTLDTLHLRSVPSMSLFQYRALTPEKKRIRLIRLLPEGFHNVSSRPPQEETAAEAISISSPLVFCEIFHVPLEQAPPYVALSYAWGSVIRKRPVLVNNATFFVGENLELALHHLTPQHEPFNIWIDALSIDQEDEVERTEQVQQMQQIYSRATSVISWLGPAADDGLVAMNWIQHYGSMSFHLGIGKRPELQLVPLLQRLEADERSIASKDLKGFLQEITTQFSSRSSSSISISIALSKFFNRAYWSRTWVVQEIVHAKSVQFMCGKATVSEDILHRALRLVRNFSLYQNLTLARHPDAPQSDAMIIPFDTRSAVVMFKIRRIAQPLPLIYLIRSLRYLKATDPRDKIFALLSFAKDAAELGIRADYRKSCQTVYTEATLALIKSGYLEILSLCSANNEIQGLPSWVPDFSTNSMRAPLQQRAMKRQVIPVETALQPTFSGPGTNTSLDEFAKQTKISERALSLQAVLLGEVENLGSCWSPRAFGRWLQDIENCLDHISDQDPADHLRIVFTTAVADQERRKGNEKPRLSNVSLLKVQNALKDIPLKFIERQSFTSLGLEDYCYQMQDIANGRRPFYASGAYVGIGPSETHPGDLLYILHGAPVPFILRRTMDGTLRFVGEAYVYGIMDGMAIQDSLSFEQIEIH